MTHRFKDATRQFLADRHSLMALIFGLVRDVHAADDILQEVWLKLAEALENGADIQDPVKWCRGVAKNLILHWWRDNQKALVVADSRILDLVEKALEEQDTCQDQWRSRHGALMSCVEMLPDHLKDLLRLVYSEGLPQIDVARKLQKSHDAVMKSLSRVRQLLFDCVRRKLSVAESAS